MTATAQDIITLPDPRLHERSRRIGHIDASIAELAKRMAEATLDWEASRQHETGVALAAVQIAELERVIIVRNDFDNKADHEFSVFINPEIVKYEGEPKECMEGCLSVKDLYGVVKRYPKVKVKALNLDGEPVRLTATDFLAEVFQHEIDHTNGIVFVDRVEDSTKLFHIEADGQLTPPSPEQLAQVHTGTVKPTEI
jgi:peptide deformylase